MRLLDRCHNRCLDKLTILARWQVVRMYLPWTPLGGFYKFNAGVKNWPKFTVVSDRGHEQSSVGLGFKVGDIRDYKC